MAWEETSQYCTIIVILFGNTTRIAEHQTVLRDVLSNHRASADGGAISHADIGANLRMGANIYPFANYRPAIVSIGRSQLDLLINGAAGSDTAISYLNPPEVINIEAGCNIGALIQVDTVGLAYASR